MDKEFTPTPKIIKKKRCNYENCNNKAATIIGDCSYCSLKYCISHRLPEAHLCTNIQECKDISFKRNQDKLLSEKCIAAKV